MIRELNLFFHIQSLTILTHIVGSMGIIYLNQEQEDSHNSHEGDLSDIK